MSGDALHNCPRCNFALSQERSMRGHRFFHVVVSIAYDNWPETHAFRPDCREHLQAWLLCHPSVGHCEIIDAAPDPEADVFVQADFYERLLSRVRAAGGYAFATVGCGLRLCLKLPRSMKLLRNGGPARHAHNAIITRVIAAIGQETGIKIAELTQEARRALAPNRLGRAV